ncbi:TonB-dependent receptor [Hyphococcus luteus]|uniref:Secretin/TonB short N-terminal domain-containing protein n=1 Tax=Hyphococcus luteus TaxID=2058213 RepID=A0A2S7K3V0_9PROT|nr:TonB-dependent receptor [Marinicaulis flavus]PQA87172.1 hypothetical protein CW354_14125 [Marinicaulis flavus]
MSRKSNLFAARRMLGAASALAILMTISAPVCAEEQAAQFDIPSQPLSEALAEFSRQSKINVVAPSSLTRDKVSNAVVGEMEPEKALETLIGDASFSIRTEDDGSLILAQATADAQKGRLFRVAQTVPREARAVEDISSERIENQETQDSVVVTGTRIKGIKDQFSPVTQIGREDMELAGNETIADVLDDLPQNFGGGIAQDAATSINGPGGASVNLRGLGNESTLVLLNGRRLAPGGLRGSYVDISSIPSAAIDRIEVMSDGASAIYGSDAVAGVVNIILRDDFSGAESRLNLSTLTEGGGNTIKAGQTFGWSDDRAHALVSYEYSSEDNLDVKEKAFSENTQGPYYLLPYNQKHSVFSSGGAKLTDRMRVAADGYYSKRKSKSFETSGSAADTLYWEGDLEQYGASASIHFDLTEEWAADLSGAYSWNGHTTEALYRIPTSLLGTSADSKSEIISVDGSLGGPLFNLTDEAVRVVVGGHFRTEAADQLYSYILSGGNQTALDVEQNRDVFAFFGEIYAPLVSEGDSVPGIKRLAVTAAVRREDYNDVGSSIDPRVGAVWSPFEGLSVRGTWGTAFRAPRLEQLRDILQAAILGVYVDPETPMTEQVALVLSGQTSNLKPEQAETWTVGMDFSPTWLDGFNFRGTYFDIAYTGRIGIPSSRLNASFQFTDFTGIPVENLSVADVQGYVNSADRFINYADYFPSLGSLVIEDVEVILDRRPQNLSSADVAGFDLEASYDFSSSVGDVAVFVNSTILTAYEQRVSPSTPLDDTLDTFANPLDFRLKGGVQWRTNPVTAAVYINYADDYLDDEALDGGVKVGSWTTMDASVRVSLGEMMKSNFANETYLTLSASNIFDKAPPMIGGRPPLSGVIYDRANADPSGRRIGLLLTKRW